MALISDQVSNDVLVLNDNIINNPYTVRKLYTQQILYPRQMNNDVYLNLKKNLINELQGKCYGKHGFIVNIYEILSFGGGEINPNNMSGSALFDIEFSCKLCLPLKNQHIIAKIDKINKMLIRVVNGPITIIIPNNRIDYTNFKLDHNGVLRSKKEKSMEVLSENANVIVTILSTIFFDGDNRIIAMGLLNRMATPDEIKKHTIDSLI